MVYLIIQVGSSQPSITPFENSAKMDEFLKNRDELKNITILPIFNNVFYANIKEKENV